MAVPGHRPGLPGAVGPVRCRISEPVITLGLEPGDPRTEVFTSEALRDLSLVTAKAAAQGGS